MDGFSNNNNDAFDRNFGRINPYAEKYGTQNPQEAGFNPQQMRPQQDPRVAPRPQMQTPYPQYNPYQQPQGQMVPPQQQVPPQYIQQQGQISQQDFEDQFDYTRAAGQPIGMQMPPQQMMPQQIQQPQPQPKKRGFFSFMSKKQEPVVQQPMYAQQFVNLQTPQSINDIKVIINMLKAGDTVLVDFSKTNDQQSQRMLDFLSGASFALGGLMQQMGEKKFVLTPPGTGIRGQLGQ